MKKINALFLLLFLVTIVYARSSYTGYTRKTNTNGCSCHGSAKSSITVTINGPNQVIAGGSATFDVTISGGTGSEVCVDIAASAGSLQTFDSNLKISNNELITNGIKSYSNGQYTYKFNYTAPSTLGNQTLYATGLPSRSSGWNFAPDKIISVVSPSGVKDSFVPGEFFLEQNYPNPFNPATIISYKLPITGFVSIKIFDALGKEITSLVNEEKLPGTYEVKIDCKNWSSGIYFYKIQSGAFTQTKKMILMK